MRAREAWQEVVRDAVSGTSRFVFAVVAVSLLTVSFGSVDATAQSHILRQAYAFNTSGASVFTLSVPEGIDGDRCDGLTDTMGVVSSGATRDATIELAPVALPSGGPVTIEATSEFLTLVEAEVKVPSSGVVLAESLAKEIGRTPGSYIDDVERGRTAVIGTFSDARFGDRLAYVAVGVVPSSGKFDDCWVRVRDSTLR